MNHQSSKENCVQFIVVLRFHYLQLEVRHKKKEIAELSALSLSLSLSLSRLLSTLRLLLRRVRPTVFRRITTTKPLK